MYTLKSLEERLRSDDLPVNTWGLPGTATKSVMDLLREIQEGSASLTPYGPVTCSRHSVCTEVTFMHELGKELILVEDRQVFPDGTPLKRGLRCVRESWQGKESFSATACRGLFEELDILVDPRDIINENETVFFGMSLRRRKPVVKKYESPVYPKLKTVRTEWHVSHVMKPAHFNPAGYTFREHGITTYFTWYPYSAKEKPPAQ